MFRNIFLIITLLYYNNIMTTHGALHFKTVKLDCFPDSKYFYANHSCRLKPINRYKSVGIMDVYIKNVLRNVTVNVALYARNDANVYKPFLINNTQNACSWLANKKGGPYINYLMKSLEKLTNINHTCPFTGAVSARNFYVDSSIVPVPLPKNSYMLKVLCYEGYPLDFIGSISYYADVIEDRN